MKKSSFQISFTTDKGIAGVFLVDEQRYEKAIAAFRSQYPTAQVTNVSVEVLGKFQQVAGR